MALSSGWLLVLLVLTVAHTKPTLCKQRDDVLSLVEDWPNAEERSASGVEGTLAAWRSADAVCFDVDRTVVVDERLDQLSDLCGKGEQIRNITKECMEGKLDFGEGLRARLNTVRPSKQAIEEFVRTHPPRLTPGIRDLVSTLQARQVVVYLVSGGFRSLFAPVAAMLNIPDKNVYANRLHFDFDGEYAGFDEEQPTTRSSGKAEVIGSLVAQHGHSCVVMVGDGINDMEACPPAQACIGFGGNVVRPVVKERAALFVTDFRTLIDELKSA